MTEFKVGDRVRLTGEDWETAYDELSRGDIVEVNLVDSTGIWTEAAGSVGRNGELYSENNPEGSGDYSCELVSGNSEAAIRNRRDSFVETVAKFTGPAVTKEDIEEIATLGEQLGISSFEQSVRRHTGRIANLLIEKNKAYGDSALNPIRVFSKADRMEQLHIRIDDKISRIQKGTDFANEDTIDDLIGYLFLLKIAEETA